MQFSCDRQRLADLLGLLSEAVPARSPKPVLQNVRIDADGNPENTLTFSATDLEIALRHRLEVRDLTDAEAILLPAARLTALLRDDRSADVSFAVSGNVAKIATQYGRFQLLGSAADDFPELPAMPAENRVRLQGDDIADALKKTMFAAARGEMRYALNGVYVTVQGDTAEFVASDTHRLSRVTKRAVNPDGVDAHGIAITKGMNTLAHLSAGRETVELVLTDKQLLANTLDATLAVRLIEGHFPRYRDVIPENLDKRITVNREELLWRLRSVGILTNEETRGVKFEATGGDRLIMKASGNEAGEGTMEIEAQIEGGDVTLDFNYTYLLDLFKVVDDESVTFQVRDGQSPVRVDSGDFTHVIMPLRGH